ncbi:hypothetical protein F2Q70_00036936 [Brassica cretica]|uniref:Uncharacterized protein n=1 Tax=Brassica cretica TaxID=69181 RepID=A0A8S9JQS6_BRACR|nr:hypothetical protein F2Q70_00036936 [Brassica cretica]
MEAERLNKRKNQIKTPPELESSSLELESSSPELESSSPELESCIIAGTPYVCWGKSKTQSLTATKILLLDTHPATVSSEGNNTTATSEETFKSRVDSAEGSKSTYDSDEIEEAKHHKRGN